MKSVFGRILCFCFALLIYISLPSPVIAGTIIYGFGLNQNQPYVDTGIDVITGDFLTFRAEGTSLGGVIYPPGRHWPEYRYGVGVNGDQLCIANHYFTLPGAPCWSLVARIGNNAHFFINFQSIPNQFNYIERFMKITQAGRVYLGINHAPPASTIGSGGLGIKVIHNFFPPPPTPTPTPEPTPTPIPTPSPFLELPWDYEDKGLSFTDAALAINSYFDHEYPLLSVGKVLSEPNYAIGLTLGYDGDRSREVLERRDSSSHDGYDWGFSARANNGDPQLAAASGCAIYNYDGACGNQIIINHNNGYFTKYCHLQKDELLTFATSFDSCVPVSQSEQIGLIGFTGTTDPDDVAGGAHIHFMVIQDKDNDGNFENNIPDGIIDPFGWQSDDPDPWPLYNFSYLGQSRTGNKSYYLWNQQLESLKDSLTEQGKGFSVGRYNIIFPPGVTSEDLDISLQASPVANPSATLTNIGSGMLILAYDALGNLVTGFQQLFTITVDFSPFNLSRYDENSLSIYSSDDGTNWNQEETLVDLDEKTATAQVDHLTYFALMAERLDTTPPTTTPLFTGLGNPGSSGSPEDPRYTAFT